MSQDRYCRLDFHLRAILVGGIIAFAKVAGAMKVAGGVKLGVVVVTMSVAATATMAGSKWEVDDASK
uniref:Uncharacterized protein n=1 Tax=Nelumbo nucifera TaxID=4432 RepID=A0A822XW45_NELNU|nr:TPA_asm: hypothetical protein HUJ06_023101 [Nelumbo nucifera]